MVLDNLPDILNIVIRRLENFLRVFEKKFTLKIGIFEPYTNRILRVDFSKIQTFVRFLPYNLFDVSYDPNFFFERKDMIINNLSNIFSVVTRRLENFLRVFEKKSFGPKTYLFIAYVKPILRVDF